MKDFLSHHRLRNIFMAVDTIFTETKNSQGFYPARETIEHVYSEDIVEVIAIYVHISNLFLRCLGL